MDHLHRRSNPFRSPDWRWQRAGYVVDNAPNVRLTRNRDDAQVRKAVTFRQKQEAIVNDRDYGLLLEADEDCFYAWQMSQDDSEFRFEVEARVLTGQTTAEIAEDIDASPELVQWYEDWFFDVRPKLHLPSYITQVVFGRSIQAGLSDRQYDLLWKIYAYWGGPWALEAIMYRFARPKKPETVEQADSFFRDDSSRTLAIKASVAMRTMPVSWQTQEPIMNLYFRMQEMERSAGEGSSQAAVEENVKVFMENLPWAKGPIQNLVPSADSSLEDRVDASGFTLRSREMSLIALGQVPAGLQHLADSAVFPEKQDAENE